MMDTLNQERRKFLRFNAELPITLKNFSGQDSKGVLVDCSRFGLRAILSPTDHITPDSSVELFIQYPTRKTVFAAKGIIQWHRKSSDSSEVGIALTDILPGDKSEILDYGYKQWLLSMACG